MTSPVGVQSMNIGLREAHELATLVADDLAGKPGMGARLNEYGQQRLAEWRRLFGIEGGLAPIRLSTHQSWNRGILATNKKEGAQRGCQCINTVAIREGGPS